MYQQSRWSVGCESDSTKCIKSKLAAKHDNRSSRLRSVSCDDCGSMNAAILVDLSHMAIAANYSCVRRYAGIVPAVLAFQQCWRPLTINESLITPVLSATNVSNGIPLDSHRLDVRGSSCRTDRKTHRNYLCRIWKGGRGKQMPTCSLNSRSQATGKAATTLGREAWLKKGDHGSMPLARFDRRSRGIKQVGRLGLRRVIQCWASNSEELPAPPNNS